ncbi:MAG: nickel pincer cofactor biosynthesis protein LarC [Acidobacteriota bacterium]
MKAGSHLHLDCHSGIAGDMFLGACLDLGMPLEVLTEAVDALDLTGVAIESFRALRGGISGIRFRVLEHGAPVEGPDPEEEAGGRHHHRHGDHGHRDHEHDHSHGRTLSQIVELIAGSRLGDEVKATAMRLFQRLGEAEAKVHGMAIESVHFHEVGAIDSIVDLVGIAAAFHHLAPDRITAGSVRVGSGEVMTAHGRLPVPAPATAELLAGIPIRGEGVGELVTPTGAVILAELVGEVVDQGVPAMVLEATGYGLGRREIPGQPNALRILRGRGSGQSGASPSARVTVIETEIDDLPAEGLGHLFERLLEAGALDAYLTPVQMKKNRPGCLVTVLCRKEERLPLANLLLAESGSLGCRWHEAERLEAERSHRTVETPWGPVRVKEGFLAGRALSAAPEYEDCRKVARAAGVTWREVWRAAQVASDAGHAAVEEGGGDG